MQNNGKKKQKPIWPCPKCKDNGPKREWGICNDGLGICEECLDYWHDLAEYKRARHEL